MSTIPVANQTGKGNARPALRSIVKSSSLLFIVAITLVAPAVFTLGGLNARRVYDITG